MADSVILSLGDAAAGTDSQRGEEIPPLESAQHSRHKLKMAPRTQERLQVDL